MAEEEKHFDEWMDLKGKLHDMDRVRTIHEGEIWWCAMDENVGVEINGKHEVFSRPVLIFKKLSRYGFMGIPLTSKEHEGNWFVPFIFQNKKQTVVLSQARVMSVARLYKKMGTVPNSDFNDIKTGFSRLYLGSK